MEGSKLYYACLFETPKNRFVIIAIHALHVELTEIVRECSDPGIARIKYKWWQEEIQRLADNKPRHPVTKTIHELINITPDFCEELQSIIEYLESLYFIEQHNSLDEILEDYKQVSGKIFTLIGNQLGIEENNIQQVLNMAGALCLYLSDIQIPKTYINESRCIIPKSYVALSSLINYPTQNDDINKKLLTLIEDLRHKLLQQEDALIKFNNRSLLHIIILLRLNRILCQEILSSNHSLLTSRTELTPIRQLWIAWRTHFTLRLH